MTHKKYLLTRILCSGSIFILSVFMICRAVSFIHSGGELTAGKVIPVIIAAGAAFFVFAVVLGRVFCGFLCPLGLFFDVIWRVTEVLHLPKLRRDEKFMRIIAMINKVFLAVFICGIVSLIAIPAFFPEILNGMRIPAFALIIAAAVMISVNSFARRFFCNVCPIGSFIGLFARFSIVKMEKDCEGCLMCGACYEACPMRIKEIYTEISNKNISSPQCIYCGECIRQCQADNALSVTVCGKKIYSSSEKDFLRNQFSGITMNRKREK